MEKWIVIGGNHYNTLWLIRSLGVVGISADVIILDSSNKSFVFKSKYVHSYILVHQETDVILELERRKTDEKQVILSSSDVVTKVLDLNYEQLKDSYVIPNCNREKGKVLHWMDKSNMIKVAQMVGIMAPRTIPVHINDGNMVVSFESLKYPCLIKPQMSVHGHKEDFRICNDRNELKVSIDSLKGSCEDILIQQYIERDFEFVVNGVRYGNQHIIPGVVRKVKVGNKLNNMGMTTIAYTDPNIGKYINIDQITQMMDEIGFEGIYSIEFIVSDGVPYLLEINFRSDATIYISTTGGVNLPALWGSLIHGNDVAPSSYKKRAFGMAEISYIKELPWKTPCKILGDWWRTDCYSIFSWKDIKPFFYKFIYAI